MWSGSTLKFLFSFFGVLAAIKVQSASEELCPRQEPLPGVLVLKLGSNVVLGCRGGVSVDGVPLASASVTNKKYRNKQTEDITVSWTSQTDFHQDYDYEEERSRVTRGIKKRTRWTLNGRQLHSGVERGGILRRPHLSWADAGNYSCYRGERLISTFRISVGVPPERPTVYCYKKIHTSKVRCDWTSKNPVTPRPLCYLLLIRELFGNVTRVPCSFSRSRCWCAFHVEEGDRALHVAKLCVSNTAGNATSPYLSFKLHDIIKPDPPTRVGVRAVEGQKHMLKVSWSYPSSWKHGFYALHFQLRYRSQLAEQYQSVLIYDRMDRHVSWTMYDALPHTQYEVQLRAKDEFDGVWSDWTDTVYAVSWTAPETTTTSESITMEPFEMFPEGSGGSGEDPGVDSEKNSSKQRQKPPQIGAQHGAGKEQGWKTTLDWLDKQHGGHYNKETRKEPCEETETECPVVPGDQVYLRVFRRKWNEPRREGPYKVVRATPTAVQVEGSTTWYHLNHSTRVPKIRTERERNRQADNSGKSDEERPVTQDEVQTDESSKKDPQGAHILLSDKQERRKNESDNISDDYHMPNADNSTSSSCSRQPPDFPRINFHPLS